MIASDAAKSVLTSVGGKDNVIANGLCMTRLRIAVANPTLVNRETLLATPGVLGIVSRGSNGLEVVFGPRAVRGVFESFVNLTGLEPTIDIAAGAPQSASFNVHITPRAGEDSPSIDELASAIDIAGGDDGRAGAKPSPDGATAGEEDEIAVLADLLAGVDGNTGTDASPSTELDDGEAGFSPDGPSLLVINGPNINMLGIREPDLYGKEDYAALLELCRSAAREAGFSSCECFQSNHEGDIVDRIQDAYGNVDGIVINPAAYTHTSVAILDALKAVSIPTVEVHISKVGEREDFRQVSYVRPACFETIMGMGIKGYEKAIFDLAERLDA